jgi:DNA (cytosine-5)-methyltransferase 1
VAAVDQTVLSVFSGLGGLDLGLEAAGFRSVGCIEVDPTARRSLKANRDGSWPRLEPGDVEALSTTLRPTELGLEEGELALLAGAPPCQPYSNAALWSPGGWNGLSDPRARPLFAFLDLIDRLLPACVLMENVSGFASGRHAATPTITRALETINRRHSVSYTLQTRVLDMSQFGVPQRRRRAILVALRDGGEFAWPEATHADAPVRAWDALVGLDDPSPAPQPRGRWADLLPSIPEGENYLWHTDRGGGRPLFGYRTRYWSFLLKLAKAMPSWTVSAQPGPSSGPFHWDNRPLRTTELLCLQSFPQGWVVEGSRREQVLQVGNATPPLMAELLGRSTLWTLDGRSWSTPPKYAVPRSERVPPPEPVRPVPHAFLVHEGRYRAHPGVGLGPRPRDS